MTVFRSVCLVFVSCSNCLAQLPEVFSDNFDDNNIDGWRFVDPIGEIIGNSYSSFSVENGQVRIIAPATPDVQLGLARAAIGFESILLSDFEVSVEVVARSNEIGSGVGIGARAREGGAGTSDGYFASFAKNSEDSPQMGFAIFRFDDEVPFALTGDPIPFELDDDSGVRLEFRGEGSMLTASVFDLNEPANLLATATAVDDTYSSGFPWFFASGNLDELGIPIVASNGDATFDNYQASGTLVPEPSSMSLLALGLFLSACRRRRKKVAVSS